MRSLALAFLSLVLCACATSGERGPRQRPTQTAAVEATPPQADLEQWLGAHFQTVVEQCVPRANNRTYEQERDAEVGLFIPTLIRSDSFFVGKLSETYHDFSGSTLTRIFGGVYAGADLSRMAVDTASPLPDNYARYDDVLVAHGFNTWRVVTNCSFALEGALNARLKNRLTFQEISAGIRADYQQSGSDQFEIVFGVFESPISVQYGGANDRRTPEGQVHYGLMLWDWHDDFPDTTRTGTLLTRFRGVAVYRTSQRNQQLRTRADLRVGGESEPVIKASGQTDNSNDITLSSFSVVALQDDGIQTLTVPEPSDISAAVRDQQVFQLVERTADNLFAPRGNNTYPRFSGGAQVRVYQFSDTIPRRYCQAWAVAEGQFSIVEAQYLVGTGPRQSSGCLFTLAVNSETAARATRAAGRIRLNSSLRDSHFEIPLATVNFQTTDLPRVASDPNRPNSTLGSASTAGEGIAMVKTWVWNYAFAISEGNTAAERVSRVVEAASASFASNCPGADNQDLSTTARMETSSSGRKWLLVTISRSLRATSDQGISTNNVACEVNISATALLGPDEISVPFTWQRSVPIVVPVRTATAE